MISNLNSSSPELLNLHHQQQQQLKQQQYHHHHHHHPPIPSRLFQLPKSRSQLHHHHHHHHHQPSWSSSLSAFSLQRSSAFLIDEYGNEHDPEHCQFKTLAAPPNRRSASSSSSNHSIASSPDSRSLSSSSTHSPIESIAPSPSNSNPPSIHLTTTTTTPPPPPRSLLLLKPRSPSNPHPFHSSWSSIKTRQHNKSHPFKQAKIFHHPTAQLDHAPQHQDHFHHHHTSSWTGKIWSHLLRPYSNSSSSHLVSSTNPLPTPISSNQTSQHTLFKRKRKLCITRVQQNHQLYPYDPTPSNYSQYRPCHQHVCGMRKRLELVKLELRFGILRTRKRFVGVWTK